VFAPQTVSRSAKNPGSLVSGSHCNYKKAKEHYSNTITVTIINYVQPCSISLCRQVATNPEMHKMLLNSKRQKAVEENRNRLSHMIRTIEFCVRQEIPLRGHRDAGAFSLNETDCNDGVFKAALRLPVEPADKQTSDLF